MKQACENWPPLGGRSGARPSKSIFKKLTFAGRVLLQVMPCMKRVTWFIFPGHNVSPGTVYTGTKRDAGLALDGKGMLKVSKRDRVEPMACHNETELHYALTHRGLALE